jgi:hypothetical protein
LLGQTPGNPFVISASAAHRKIKQNQTDHVHLARNKGIDSGARNKHCVANTQHHLIFDHDRYRRNYPFLKAKAPPIGQVPPAFRKTPARARRVRPWPRLKMNEPEEKAARIASIERSKAK